MTSSLVTLCSVCLMAAAVPGQAKHRLEGATFGSKSSYFPVANLDDSPVTDLAEVAGCQPVMLWMYVRHGTRNGAGNEPSRSFTITTRASSYSVFHI